MAYVSGQSICDRGLQHPLLLAAAVFKVIFALHYHPLFYSQDYPSVFLEEVRQQSGLGLPIAVGAPAHPN
jgi:hypothetical protein